jgi:hypothetical protein
LVLPGLFTKVLVGLVYFSSMVTNSRDHSML